AGNPPCPRSPGRPGPTPWPTRPRRPPRAVVPASGDPPQLGAEPLAAPDVALHRVVEVALWHLVALPDPGRHADRHPALRDLRSRRHDGTGRDDGPGSDPGAVEHDRTGRDEGVVADHRALDVHVVPDGDLAADDGRLAQGAVDDRPVLHAGARPDLDPPVVAAQHGGGPDRGLRADGDVPDHDGVRVDV